ncbi:MAG: TonB-dependent receptor plug domain-containing protein [Selenomonas massiliensis]
MTRKQRKRSLRMLTYAILAGLTLPAYTAWADDGTQGGGKVSTADIHVEVDAAQEEAKTESQQKTIITKEDIEKKQAKSVEDIIFSETGVSRTVDAMGRVGVSIRGAEPRHTLILVDGQPVLGDLAKYSGAADEVMRLGTENVERIEIIQGAASAKYGSDAIGGVVNIITRKATKEPGFQFNWEGLKTKNDDGLPFSNFFLRADSGQMGKLRLGLSGSKREIMPVYASVARRKTGMGFEYGKRDFKPNALRAYGDTATIGLVGTYEPDNRNTFEVRMDHYTEDLVRDVKHSDSDLEPQQHFKRQADRDSYNIGWSGYNNASDWKVELNSTNIKENDVSLINYDGKSAYEGKNELRYVDDVDHRQIDLKASMNTQLNDKHLLSFGFGITNERGSGSRLKSSPNLSTRRIDAWDYDKSLRVDKRDWLTRDGDEKRYVWSHIHDYKYKTSDDPSHAPEWDFNYEYYYYDKNTPNSFLPKINYETYLEHIKGKSDIERRPDPSAWNYSFWTPKWSDNAEMTWDEYNAYVEMDKKLREQNPSLGSLPSVVEKYFSLGSEQRADAPKLNGKAFLEEYWNRDQRITVGSGTINKQHFFVGDTWQLSKDTILFPILRVDHSNLFGTNLSGSIGVTHNLGGSPHARFKANIGTSYAEPGMGELWYNWEMYASNPVGIGDARLGWWWAGNPNLKPEKSVNIDMNLEGETKNTYARVGVFHNRIRDYMTVYFTGNFMDFAPNLGKSAKWMRAPDMIYSFKNIGKAEITGLEAEVRQKIGPHWNARLGYTYLHAINKSDPLMPKRLLDRPTHKVDIGISYEDKKTGWFAQLWGDYYIRMLDSNTLANGANYWSTVFSNNSAVYSNKAYQEKTFGIWNFMVQKKLGENAMVYLGVNNIFNHRDDDRATQERVYRIGANFKFDTAGPKKSLLTNGTTEMGAQEEALLNKFLARPFDESKAMGVNLIGDYQLRWTAHNGTNRPQSTYTADSSVSEAAVRNMRDANEHGFEQRIRVGADARVAEDTNIRILGSLSGTQGVDPAHSQPDSKGLGKARLEQADVTQRMKKWDLSLGRLTEPIGVTGYWFGSEYDGIRGVYTGKTSQLRVGFGTFKQSTGVSDTAYTHVTYTDFYRPPTAAELMGILRESLMYGIQDEDVATLTKEYEENYKGKTNNAFFYQQIKEAYDNSASIEEKTAIIKRLHGIVKAAYGNELANKVIAFDAPSGTQVLYEVEDAHGNVKVKKTSVSYSSYISEYDSDEEKAFKTRMNQKFGFNAASDEALRADNSYLQNHKNDLMSAFNEIAEYNAKQAWGYYGATDDLGDVWSLSGSGDTMTGTSTYDSSSAADYRFKRIRAVVTEDSSGWPNYTFTTPDTMGSLYQDQYENETSRSRYGLNMSNILFNYLEALEDVLRKSESVCNKKTVLLIGTPVE